MTDNTVRRKRHNTSASL